jgi:hypothetical protein
MNGISMLIFLPITRVCVRQELGLGRRVNENVSLMRASTCMRSRGLFLTPELARILETDSIENL